MYKKIIFVSFLLLNLGITNAILFQQWFSSITENNWEISFNCKKQCLIWVKKLDNIKKLKISWDFKGNGIIAYWFLIWQNFIPWKQKKVKNHISFYLEDNRFYNKIPKKSIIILVFNWNVSWKNVTIKTSNTIEFKKIIKDFFKIEWITPYIINLKYWWKVLWIPSTKFFTYLALIFIVLVLLFVKNNKFKYVLYISIMLTAILAIKNLYEYITVTKNNINNFNIWSKVFYLWDYYSFIKEVRKNIDFKNCSYKFISYQWWPFSTWSKNVYLKPCSYSNANPKYIIIYKTGIPKQYSNCKTIYNKSYNLILKCK